MEAVQCRKGLNLLLSRLPNVLGRAASVLGCHGCGFQEQVPAGLLSVLVRNMQLDEVDVLTNHPPDCSGQFAGNWKVAIAAKTVAGDSKVDESNLIDVMSLLGFFAEAAPVVLERSLHD